MRKLLLVLVTAALVLTFVGCGGAKIEDDKFVEVWLDTYDEMDDDEAYAAALKEYDLTPDDIDGFVKDMLEDEERSEKITTDITTKDLGAGLALAGKVLEIGLSELDF
ncbi:hypothetical protein KAU45_11260 [bacterium]|nr:hypothetical protein [bacterium]